MSLNSGALGARLKATDRGGRELFVARPIPVARRGKISMGAKMRFQLPLVVLVAAFLVGCGSPATPSEKALTVFVDRDYGGSWHDVSGDWANLNGPDGPCNKSSVGTTTIGNWDDCVSSIRLSPGWVATGYRDRNFSGPTFEITQDIPNLRDLPGPCDHGFDDCLSSIRVSRR
jgi:hypothetical protein